jgi:hypothetical protein
VAPLAVAVSVGRAVERGNVGTLITSLFGAKEVVDLR